MQKYIIEFVSSNGRKGMKQFVDYDECMSTYRKMVDAIPEEYREVNLVMPTEGGEDVWEFNEALNEEDEDAKEYYSNLNTYGEELDNLFTKNGLEDIVVTGDIYDEDELFFVFRKDEDKIQKAIKLIKKYFKSINMPFAYDRDRESDDQSRIIILVNADGYDKEFLRDFDYVNLFNAKTNTKKEESLKEATTNFTPTKYDINEILEEIGAFCGYDEDTDSYFVTYNNYGNVKECDSKEDMFNTISWLLEDTFYSRLFDYEWEGVPKEYSSYDEEKDENKTVEQIINELKDIESVQPILNLGYYSLHPEELSGKVSTYSDGEEVDESLKEELTPFEITRNDIVKYLKENGINDYMNGKDAYYIFSRPGCVVIEATAPYYKQIYELLNSKYELDPTWGGRNYFSEEPIGGRIAVKFINKQVNESKQLKEMYPDDEVDVRIRELGMSLQDACKDYLYSDACTVDDFLELEEAYLTLKERKELLIPKFLNDFISDEERLMKKRGTLEEANDDLATKATKMLSEKKYQINLAWKNGKTWETEPMTLKEIEDSVGMKVTEKDFVDSMASEIQSRKDAKNLTKAEIVKLYDYIDGQWKGKDVLWSLNDKIDESKKKEEEKKDNIEIFDESLEEAKDDSTLSIKVGNISDIANLNTKKQRLTALQRVVNKYVKKEKKNIKDYKIHSANWTTDEIVLKDVVYNESLIKEDVNLKDVENDLGYDFDKLVKKNNSVADVYEDNGKLVINTSWRTTPRQVEKDRVDLIKFLDNKVGKDNYNLKYVRRDSRDNGKEFSAVLELTLKDGVKENLIKEDKETFKSLQKKLSDTKTLDELEKAWDVVTSSIANLTDKEADDLQSFYAFCRERRQIDKKKK